MSALLVSLLPTVLPALGSLVVAGLGYVTVLIRSRLRAESAAQRLALLGASLLGKAWDALGPTLQRALADGKLSDIERSAIEGAALAVLTTEDRAALEEIGRILNVPFPSLIAKLASDLVNTWALAHTPSNTTVSALAYPVQESYGG